MALERVTMPVETDPTVNLGRNSAMLCLLPGAAISLGLMFWVGRHNSSVVLLLLFTVWVASPFAGMALLCRWAGHWPGKRQKVTYSQIRHLSLGSALLYALVVVLNHFPKPAGPFLAVPVASWLRMAVWFWMTRYFHGKGSGETTVLNLSGKR